MLAAAADLDAETAFIDGGACSSSSSEAQTESESAMS